MVVSFNFPDFCCNTSDVQLELLLGGCVLNGFSSFFGNGIRGKKRSVLST